MPIGSLGNHHIETISREHYEIHEGNSYIICNRDLDLDDEEEHIIAFKTPNTATKLHFMFWASTTKETTFDFLESPTITLDTGTQIQAYNKNRSSSNTSAMLTLETTPQEGKATLNPTITADGTNLCPETMGSGKAVQGETRDVGEWILDANTVYAIRITGTINDTIAQIKLLWYECDVV